MDRCYSLVCSNVIEVRSGSHERKPASKRGVEWNVNIGSHEDSGASTHAAGW